MNKRFLGVILLIGIIVVGVLIYMKINNNQTNAKISIFNEMIMNAAEQYIQKNVEEYPEFKEAGDRVEISVQDLIDDNILKSGIDNPTDKEFKNVIIRLTIESSSTINYEVLE